MRWRHTSDRSRTTLWRSASHGWPMRRPSGQAARPTRPVTERSMRCRMMTQAEGCCGRVLDELARCRCSLSPTLRQQVPHCRTQLLLFLFIREGPPLARRANNLVIVSGMSPKDHQGIFQKRHVQPLPPPRSDTINCPQVAPRRRPCRTHIPLTPNSA